MESKPLYYPLLFLIPDFPEWEIEVYPFRIMKRGSWETGLVYFATLMAGHKLHPSESGHKIHFPSEMMESLLSNCHVELRLVRQLTHEEANATFQDFRLGLYASGLSPFIAPFVTTHSINKYSRIKKPTPALILDLKSQNNIRFEAWPIELSLECIILNESLRISESILSSAATKASCWKRLSIEEPLLRVVEDIIIFAPKLLSLDQSLLHLWSGLEALFPGVGTELSFRIAMYLAQLISPKSDRLICFERIRDAYSLRSKIVHGSRRGISLEEWHGVWSILMDAVNAIIMRGELPTEKKLLAELLE
jgi:hypothetical protein